MKRDYQRAGDAEDKFVLLDYSLPSHSKNLEGQFQPRAGNGNNADSLDPTELSYENHGKIESSHLDLACGSAPSLAQSVRLGAIWLFLMDKPAMIFSHLASLSGLGIFGLRPKEVRSAS